MLTLRPSGIGQDDDFVVLDDDRREIGRILWTRSASKETPWFWTITAQLPNTMHDRGYAATREDAMAAKVAAAEGGSPLPAHGP